MHFTIPLPRSRGESGTCGLTPISLPLGSWLIGSGVSMHSSWAKQSPLDGNLKWERKREGHINSEAVSGLVFFPGTQECRGSQYLDTKGGWWIWGEGKKEERQRALTLISSEPQFPCPVFCQIPLCPYNKAPFCLSEHLGISKYKNSNHRIPPILPCLKWEFISILIHPLPEYHLSICGWLQ